MREWVNAGLCSKVLSVANKTRKALYKCIPFAIYPWIDTCGLLTTLDTLKFDAKFTKSNSVDGVETELGPTNLHTIPKLKI